MKSFKITLRYLHYCYGHEKYFLAQMEISLYFLMNKWITIRVSLTKVFLLRYIISQIYVARFEQPCIQTSLIVTYLCILKRDKLSG